MKHQSLAVKLVKEMSASHARHGCSYASRARQTSTACNCGRCQAYEDDFFFQQICDEVEGTYKDKTVQSFGKTRFIGVS